MTSTLTIQLDMNNWPKPPTLGVIGRTDKVTDTVALIAVHEPISMAGLAKATQAITRAWLEPELFSSGCDQLHDLMAALGTRLL